MPDPLRLAIQPFGIQPCCFCTPFHAPLAPRNNWVPAIGSLLAPRFAQARTRTTAPVEPSMHLSLSYQSPPRAVHRSSRVVKTQRNAVLQYQRLPSRKMQRRMSAAVSPACCRQHRRPLAFRQSPSSIRRRCVSTHAGGDAHGTTHARQPKSHSREESPKSLFPIHAVALCLVAHSKVR